MTIGKTKTKDKKTDWDLVTVKAIIDSVEHKHPKGFTQEECLNLFNTYFFDLDLKDLKSYFFQVYYFRTEDGTAIYYPDTVLRSIVCATIKKNDRNSYYAYYAGCYGFYDY